MRAIELQLGGESEDFSPSDVRSGVDAADEPSGEVVLPGEIAGAGDVDPLELAVKKP